MCISFTLCIFFTSTICHIIVLHLQDNQFKGTQFVKGFLVYGNQIINRGIKRLCGTVGLAHAG